jgi:hypothetical protein
VNASNCPHCDFPIMDAGRLDCVNCGESLNAGPAVGAQPDGGWDYATTFDTPGGDFTPPTFSTLDVGTSRRTANAATRWEGQTPQHLAHLIVKRGTPQGQAFQLGDAASLGRDSRANSVVLTHDESVSRQHAQIRFEDGSFVFYNLSSSYGSHLITPHGPQRITGRLVLCDGDELQIGERTVLTFRQTS